MADDGALTGATADRDRRIRERGGDPACLHCQASLAISDWLDGRPEGPVHAMQVSMALAGVIGDLMEPCEDIKQRIRCIDSVVREIGQHCGINILPTQGEGLIDADVAPPRKVH